MTSNREEITRILREQEAIEVYREEEARQVATTLIQSYVGPDCKVTNLQDLFNALVVALKAARMQGQIDRDVSIRGNS
jgi:hypothetical protein